MPAPWMAYHFDALNFLSGAGTLSTSSSPASGRQSSSIISSTTISWRSKQQPSRTSGCAGINALIASSSSSLGGVFVLLDSSLGNVLRVAQTATNRLNLQYWNGSAWVTIGSGVSGYTNTSNSNSVRITVDFDGLGTASGSATMRVYEDSADTLLGTVTGTGLPFSSLANVAYYLLPTKGTSLVNSTEHFLADGSAETMYRYGSRPTADGADTDGTGGWADLNDASLSALDTTFVSLPSSGNRRSAKNSTARDYNGRGVRAVGFGARLRCGATGPTQVRPYLTVGGTRYYHPSAPVTLNTSFESYSFTWEQNPATTADWTTADAQAASLEYGIEVV